MGFCIYCNYKVNSSATTCPKCYRTLATAKANNPQQPIVPFALHSNKTDKWQDTYGKKAIFRNNDSRSLLSHFNNVDTLKLKRNMKICAHCHEKKEESAASNNEDSAFYCKPCLTGKLACPSCKNHFSETNYVQYNEQVWHIDCFRCHQCETLLKPQLTVLNKEGHPSCRACQLRNSAAKQPVSKPRRHKRMCKQCGLHVTKKEYRGLKIQTGEIFCFHADCLLCSKCDKHFQSLEFYTDGERFYHPKCVQLTEESSLSEEDELNYPQTPPQHNSYFDIASSPVVDSLPFSDTNNNKPIKCKTCGEHVNDLGCLELENNFYHEECLLCSGCGRTVPTETKLTKIRDKLYCDICCKRNSTIITTPSDIFKSRKTVLPRLGGVHTCAGCKQSMPYFDCQSGPSTSRWHKKCLSCAGCGKPMDSDAHMTLNEGTGLYSVHCRDCLDDTPKPNYVR